MRETSWPSLLKSTSERQVGMFKGIHSLAAELIERTVVKVCGACVRQPTWWKDEPASDLPCKARLQLLVVKRGKSRRIGAMKLWQGLSGRGRTRRSGLDHAQGAAAARRTADVVIYDRLIPPELLWEARPRRRIDRRRQTADEAPSVPRVNQPNHCRPRLEGQDQSFA